MASQSTPDTEVISDEMLSRLCAILTAVLVRFCHVFAAVFEQFGLCFGVYECVEV
jgi:hypothetical protein